MATISEFINKVGFKVNKEDVGKVNNTISQIKNTATKILGVIGIGFSLTAVNQLVEEFTRVKQQISNSTSGLGDQAAIQQQILESANATRSTYADTAKMVSNLVHENANLFGSVDEAIKFNDAATMLFKTAGKTNEDIAGLMEAINKSFAKGYVDSETLSRLLEKSPEAVELLNKKLGTTSDQLGKMASDGKFTVEDLKNAFVDSANEIEARFGNVKMSITEAITVIRNKFGLWLADTNEMLDITDTIGGIMVKAFDGVMRVVTKVRTGIVWLSEKVGGFNNLLKLVAIVAGSIFLAFNFQKIVNGVSSLISIFSKLNLKTIAIVAAIALVALAVEDFINFMKGNNSLLGSMLEKAGIDADAVRQTIIDAWENVKSFLLTVWDVIKKVCTSVWDGIKSFFKKHGEAIKTALLSAWKAIKTVLSAYWETLSAIATTIFSHLQAFWAKHGETIIAALVKAWEIIKNALSAAWDFILTTAITIFDGITAFFDKHGEAITQAIVQVWEFIMTTLVAVWDFLIATAKTLFEGLQQFWEKHGEKIKTSFSNIWIGIKNNLTAIWNSLMTVAKVAFEAIKTVVTAIFNRIKQFWDTWGNTIKTYFSALWDYLKAVFGAALDIIVDLFAIFSDLFAGDWSQLWEDVKTLVSDIWNGIVNIVSTWLEAMKEIISSIFAVIWSKIVAVWDNIKASIKERIDSIKDDISNVWESIKSATASVWEGIKSSISSAVDNVKSAVTNAFNSLKSTVSSIWNGIKNSITSAIDGAWTAVSNVVNKLKNAFNFEWSLPELKLPHITVTGGVAPYGIGGKGSLPQFNIQWYKKGGILDGATIFGAMNGKLLGGGEAGKEAVLPLSELWKNMREIVRGGLSDLVRILQPMASMSAVSTSTVSNVSNSSVSKNIIQNVAFNNEFHGDTAIQRHAATTMKKSSADVTAELARGLAYAR